MNNEIFYSDDKHFKATLIPRDEIGCDYMYNLYKVTFIHLGKIDGEEGSIRFTDATTSLKADELLTIGRMLRTMQHEILKQQSNICDNCGGLKTVKLVIKSGVKQKVVPILCACEK